MCCIVFAQDGRGMGQGLVVLENRVCEGGSGGMEGCGCMQKKSVWMVAS